MKNIDPYKILEVDPRASSTVIKAAYQALIKIHHPDHHGDEQKAKDLNAGYEMLSDSDKKKKYDKSCQEKTGTIVGNYKLLEAIAEGGFGTTYKAEHLLTNELVCVKHCS